MPKPNTTFKLNVTDLDIIESALRSRKLSLSQSLAEVQDANADVKDSLHQIHDLLGRLHNQKNFYRPQTGVYVGG